MATIRKRGTHQWQAVVRKTGYPRYSSTFKTKTDAVRWADKIEESIKNDTFKDILKADYTSLEEVMERYLKDVIPLKKCVASEEYRYKLVTGHLRHLKILGKPIGKVTPDDMIDYIEYRESTVCGRTINIELALVSHVFTKARKKYRIKVDNPVSDIEKPKEAKGRNRRCTRKEEQMLINAAKGFGRYTDMQIIIPFAIETTMRRGEIGSLVWEHVDFDSATVYLPDTKNGSERTVPLSPRALDLLKRCSPRESGNVFSYEIDSITRAFAGIRNKAGIQNLRFHDLRHEAASRLFEKGLGAADIKLITGHKTYEMLDRYTHLSARNISEKLAKIDEMARLDSEIKTKRAELRLVA